MPPLKRICKITGHAFEVSELEQQLRAKFEAPLPDIHPYERLRYLMQFRNVYTLYNDTCDLCGTKTLSVWGESPNFPVYCRDCWYSDKWAPVEMDLDLERPFFEQHAELIARSPHPARIIAGNMENSAFCNSCSNLKSCYMTFNATGDEDCYYATGIINSQKCVDTVSAVKGEIQYQTVACHQSYKVFWSEYASNCRDCWFVYDCIDCSDCAFSTGLRHKQYVFENCQLTREQYEAKMQELRTGSYAALQKYLAQYAEMKRAYPKRYIIGLRNENASGNWLVNSKNIVDSYDLIDCEDSVNVFNVWQAKDCLDVVSMGKDQLELAFSCTSVGLGSTNIRFSSNCYENCFNLEYCSFVQSSSHDCFGSAFARKLEYTILNKRYSKEDYAAKVAALRQKMQERGEYGQVFPQALVPFAYNESIAQLYMPLTREEAEARGFRWVEKKAPSVPAESVFTPPDDIADVEWTDVDGKFLLCAESGRPFRLVKPEFEFYKQYAIALPRLHPDVRLVKRFPTGLMFNLHEAACVQCGRQLQTSMEAGDKVLCEECCQKAVV